MKQKQVRTLNKTHQINNMMKKLKTLYKKEKQNNSIENKKIETLLIKLEKEKEKIDKVIFI